MTRENQYSPTGEPLERLLSRRDLRRLFPVSDMTIWRWERTDGFPQHLTIGGRNFWRESEVAAWITSQTAKRTGGDNA